MKLHFLMDSKTVYLDRYLNKFLVSECVLHSNRDPMQIIHP